MNRINKTRSGELRACRCGSSYQLNDCNHITPTPRIGTALPALLKRYRNELQSQPPDRIIDSMIGCIDFLLIEAERLEKEGR